MSNQIEVTQKYISALEPMSVVTDKNIGEHVVNKFMAMYQVPKTDAVAFWEREKDNFMKRINDSEDLKACTPMSAFMALMQVFGWGLSFEPGEQAEVYLIMGNRNIAPKAKVGEVVPKDVWVKEMVAQPSPYGKKKIRIQNGQIKGASKPIIVYKGDKYEESIDEKGNLKVVWAKGDRGDTPTIVSSFIRIEKPDGSYEFIVFDMEDVKSWKASSEKKNAKYDDQLKKKVLGKANALYTSNNGQIDKLFFEGKTLTHAFKGYPKVISIPKLPETMILDEKSGIREGLDVSEFINTEDAQYSDVTNDTNSPAINASNELDEALKNENSGEPTLVIAGFDNDDEPRF